jgi:HSP20 family protein
MSTSNQQQSSSSQQVPVQQPSSNQRTMQSNRNRGNDNQRTMSNTNRNRGGNMNRNRGNNENRVSLWNEMFDSPIDRMFKTFLGDDYDSPLSLMNRNDMNLGLMNNLPTFKANMVEKQNEYEILADLPGINKQDVNITYKDGTLEIEGKRDRKEEWDDNQVHHSEVEYGSFYRSFYLPKSQNINVKDLKAQYNNGVLNIHIPKDKQEDTKNYRVNID